MDQTSSKIRQANEIVSNILREIDYIDYLKPSDYVKPLTPSGDYFDPKESSFCVTNSLCSLLTFLRQRYPEDEIIRHLSETLDSKSRNASRN